MPFRKWPKIEGRGLVTRVLMTHKLFNHNDLQRFKWRRRESNERPCLHNHVPHQAVTTRPDSLSALCLLSGDTDCHQLSLNDPRLSRIAAVWSQLPESVRDAVEAICLQPAFCDNPQ